MLTKFSPGSSDCCVRVAVSLSVLLSGSFHLFVLCRCDPVVVRNCKEADLIMSRLSSFLQGVWCVEVTSACNEEERAAADGEMKDWFAAAEQVRGGVKSLQSRLVRCTAGRWAASVFSIFGIFSEAHWRYIGVSDEALTGDSE